MNAKIIILVFCVSAAISYPAEDLYEIEELQPNEVEEYIPSEVDLVRHRRQVQLWGGGGGSPKQGFDLNLNSRFPIWQSRNNRNSLDGTASYGQHLGGPYGNSPPQYGGGLIFTHRF